MFATFALFQRMIVLFLRALTRVINTKENAAERPVEGHSRQSADFTQPGAPITAVAGGRRKWTYGTREDLAESAASSV